MNNNNQPFFFLLIFSSNHYLGTRNMRLISHTFVRCLKVPSAAIHTNDIVNDIENDFENDIVNDFENDFVNDIENEFENDIVNDIVNEFENDIENDISKINNERFQTLSSPFNTPISKPFFNPNSSFKPAKLPHK